MKINLFKSGGEIPRKQINCSSTCEDFIQLLSAAFLFYSNQGMLPTKIKVLSPYDYSPWTWFIFEIWKKKKRSDNLGYGPVLYELLIFLLFLPALMDYS